MKICGIYKITSIKGRIYIGQSKSIKSRWKSHKRDFGKGLSRLQKSFIKHGIENHTFEIIEECVQELLNEREVYWIKHFDSFDTPHGLNLTSGGNQRQPSKETKKKLSEKSKGNTNALNYKFTEEQRKNHSKALKGNTNGSGHKNKPKSEEHNRKNSEAQKKRPPITEETRQRQSEAAKKRAPFTEEHLKNMSDKKLGNKNAKGSVRTEEQKLYNSEVMKSKKNALGSRRTEEQRLNRAESIKKKKDMRNNKK